MIKKFNEFINENINTNVTVNFQGFECVLEFGEYGNDRVAITLIEKSTGEPVATATVNIPDVDVPEGHVIIKDYSENEGMLQCLVDAGVVSEPIDRVSHLNAPLCKLLVNQGNEEWSREWSKRNGIHF